MPTYLYPHVCFTCRKSFKGPDSPELRLCPQCKNEMVQLSRKFRTPKNTDAEAWRVVEYVVNAGFFYESIHLEGGKQARYPKTMREAEEFVRCYADRITRPTQG